MVLMRLGTTDERRRQPARGDRARSATALTTAFPGIEFLQVDSVGAQGLGRAGPSTASSRVRALVRRHHDLRLAALRVAVRVGAVLSLVHDAIVDGRAVRLLQLEFNLTIVAAVLTVIGYSINDTVVVFDRMRENLRKYKKMPLPDVMNLVAQRDAEPDGDDLADDADRARSRSTSSAGRWSRASPSR